jgi:hypothetical protein
MKPLQSAPLTDEDKAILLLAGLRQGGSIFDTIYLRKRYAWADRRDAELMWRAMWPCPACGRQTRNTFAYQVDWLWRRCRCGNIWAISPRQGL